MTESISESSTAILSDSAEKKSIRVLHVDDDVTFLKIAKKCLEAQGQFQVDTTLSVEEALERLKKRVYDAIVCDYQMPGKDGLEFLKELRANGNNTSFIVFTGKGREEIALKALNWGADGYFSKHGEPETVYGELAHGIKATMEQKKAEEALSAERDRLEMVTRSIGAGLAIISRDYRTLWANDVLKQMFGDVEGKICYSTYNQRNDICPECRVQEIFETGKFKVVHEQVGKDVDGKTVWSEIVATPVKDGDGNVTAVLELVVPITQRKRAEEGLRDSEEKYRRLVELAPDGIVAVNAEGAITSANHSFLTLVGYDSGEGIVGKPFTELKTSRVEDIPKFQSMFMSLMKGESPSLVEFLYVRKDGTNRWAEVHASLLTKDGNPVGAQVIMRDVTERKNTEERLRSLKEFSESVIDSIADSLLVIDPNDYRITSVNEAALNQLVLRREDVIGKTCYETIHHRSTPCEPPLHICPIQEVLRTGKTVTVEHTHFDKGNNETFVEVSAHPVRNREGNTVQVVHLSRDITERKKIEEELLRQKERIEQYLDIVGDIVVSLDSNGKITLLNKKGRELLGYREGELVDKEWFETCLPEEDREGVRKIFQECMQGKLEIAAHHENPILARNGEKKTVSWHNTILKDNNGKIIGTLSSGEDITERRKTEEDFLTSVEQARGLLEFQNKIIDTAIVWIDVLDAEGNVTLWNRAAEVISGYSREEVIGHKKIWEWLYPDPQYCTKIFAHAQKTIDDEKSVMQNFETVIRCKNRALKTISWYANSISDAEGRPVGSIAIGLDVSQLKEAERELHKTKEKLEIMNEKLRVAGGLTRHDVRNKLAVVTGNAYLAKKKLPENSEILDYLNQIEASVSQTVRIFDFAKTYEMLGVEELAYVDVERTVNGAVSLFSGLKDVEIANDCRGLTVLADSLLGTLFYNLIDNSLKYGEKLSRIRFYYEDKNGDCLNVIYEDDGVGIPRATKAKLFAEGYTTGKGSGYGLYLIKKMLEVYGWKIEETGKPGKGAQFVMTIPKTNPDGKENYCILTQ
jgi:PAS domain S-box-containing protein